MSRRSDPERIFTAWRVATRNRLTDSGMDLETAERWCDTWALEATGRGLPKDGAYWQARLGLDRAERAARRPGW